MSGQGVEKDAGTTWRYAITREDHDGEDFYTIREVYTSPDGSLSWTENPIAAKGDWWMECADDLALMGRAVGGPVLDLTLDPPAFVSPRTLPRRRVTPTRSDQERALDELVRLTEDEGLYRDGGQP